MTPELQFRLPEEIPLAEYPEPQAFLDEAKALIDKARERGLILRVMGPIAIHFYFPDWVDLYQRMERLGGRVFTDIDFASYGKYRVGLMELFKSEGYAFEQSVMWHYGKSRHIYYSTRIPMVDIFYDKLDMNHCVDYKGRLEIHPYCVSLADLLLQKLQIVQINDKDLKDAMLLLLAAPVGEAEGGTINAGYLAKVLADDWGFYHTATTNLGGIKSAMTDVAALNEGQRATIGEKVDNVLQHIENEPKSGKWKRRAKAGTKKPWYNEVSDWG
jgi:hypothetical protein